MDARTGAAKGLPPDCGAAWAPEDLPPRLVAVLDAASRPGDPSELAAEAAARAAFRAHYRTHPVRRRRPTRSRRFAVRAALAATAALSAAGVVAAATGHLPAPLGGGHGAAAAPVASSRAVAPSTADRAARRGLCEALDRSAAERQPAQEALAALAGGADKVADYCAQATAGAPAGAGPAAEATSGLCRAWQAGRAGAPGGREQSAAFAALVRAAGGMDKVDAYCTAAAGEARAGAMSSRHPPAATPSHPPVPSPAAARPGGPGARPAPTPTAPPGRDRPGAS